MNAGSAAWPWVACIGTQMKSCMHAGCSSGAYAPCTWLPCDATFAAAPNEAATGQSAAVISEDSDVCFSAAAFLYFLPSIKVTEWSPSTMEVSLIDVYKHKNLYSADTYTNL